MEDCGDGKTVYNFQWRRTKHKLDLLNNDNDAFMVHISGIIDSTWGQPLNTGQIRKCFKFSKIYVTPYNDDVRKFDLTKCQV